MRRQVVFSGQVQGVGFRETTRRIAAGFAVRGYVKNLADGRVELVCEGQPAELERFVGEVGRVMADFIRGAETKDLNGGEPLDGFTVRRV